MSNSKTHEYRTPRKRVRKYFEGESMTDQSYQNECDMSFILRKHTQQGLLTHVNRYEGNYSDITGLPQDYHAALNQVLEAQDVFDSLPSTIRLKFNNDPGAFVDFVGDPANIDEMVDLGLAKRRPEPVSKPTEDSAEGAVSA